MRLFLLRQGCPSALNLRSKYLGALHVGNACWQTVFDCHLSFLLVPLPVLFYTYVEVEWSAFETSRRLQTGLPVRRSKQYVSRLVLFPPSVQETGVIRRRRFFFLLASQRSIRLAAKRRQQFFCSVGRRELARGKYSIAPSAG